MERCREIFEYEMTEVLLALKGEFAVISGKETGFSPDAVETLVQIDPKPLPQVSMHEVQLEIPNQQPPVGKIEKLPEVQACGPVLPALPKVSIPEPVTLNTGSKQLPAMPEIPAVGIQTKFEMSQAEVPAVEIPNISGISLLSENNFSANKAVSVKVPSVPDICSLHTADCGCGNIMVKIRMPAVPRSINLGISGGKTEKKNPGGDSSR